MSGTDYTLTPNMGLFKPISNRAIGMWGDLWNANADALDSAVHFASGGGPFLPLAGSPSTISGPINFIATGGTAARSAQDRAAEVVNVKDFGAKGDGVTDDTAAMNAAMAYVRAHPLGGGSPAVSPQAYCVKVVIPPGQYLVTGTLNWTLLYSLTVYIEAAGANIVGRTSGKPIIDALGSRWLHVHGLTLLGDATNPPNIGLQIGRYSSLSADLHHFDCLTISGVFTFCALYNFASETTTFVHLNLWNSVTTPTGNYVLVMDGINHFNIQSQFVTVTAPVDSMASFNENLFVNASIMTQSGGGPPVWMANTGRCRFQSSYIANTSPGYCVVIYASSTVPTIQLDMDAHFESNTMTDIFYIDGPSGTAQASIRGLRYQDFLPEATNSLFKVNAANIGSVALLDADIRIDYFLNSGCKVFDNPALWHVSGRYSEVSGAHWIAPAAFQGITDQQGVVAYYGASATASGSITAGAGLHCGNITVAANNDLSKHLDLYGGLYGLCIDNAGEFNLNANTGTTYQMLAGGIPIAQINSGYGSFQALQIGMTGPTWTQGTAAPAATAPVGSIYSRVGGAVGATLYVSRGGGTWAPIAGV